MSLFGSILGGLGSIVGLVSGIGAQKESDKSQKSARAITDLQGLAFRDALGIAQDYDPEKADSAAIAEANRRANESLRQQLTNLNATFKNAGGSTNDTLFRTLGQDRADRVMDPLREMMAQSSATSAQRKINALNAAVGSGGGIANQYQQQAQQQAQKGDISGSLGLLSGIIDSFGKSGAKPKTAADLGINGSTILGMYGR